MIRGLGGLATATVAAVTLLPGGAFGSGPAVSIPSGPFTDGQQITLKGSGFPSHSQLPAGLQVIECSDPGGTVANLPADAVSGCEGVTVNPSQINTDMNGSFQTSYNIAALSSGAGTSSIDCNATYLCVLWVGVDYNNAFTSGPHAFSRPFAVTSAAVTTPTTTTSPASVSAETSAPSPAAPVQTATTAQSSLANTGIPGLVDWLVGVGGPLALLGFAGRRLTGRRESPSRR